MRRLDFADHRRELGDNAYIYAVVSRRARGLSIGVNLNPDKACNFDCPYCQVDRTLPGGARAIDLPRLRDELEHLLGLVHRGDLWHTPPFDTADPALRRVADIAFAGDGEPTTPPEFPEAARIVRECRDRLAPGVPVRLLTNATMLHLPRVRAALGDIDEPWCKLDAGTEAYFRLVDGTKFSFERILANLRDTAARRPIVIQSMFMTLDGEGPTEAEVDAWVARLVTIGPREVQVYSVARKPSDPRVGPLPSDRLAHIASRARDAGLVAVVA
ncbi:MAG: radical SAM protein [Deltaproteobacteria bacterium]|nr:radical SAM protein [Deltaproteobacteria bacterium]